ncbi:hypothetical protein OBBRIDRAFT_372786 [Obba rivulosa]|uniref:Uncharacterized protein n=1 Tax=Obba rivulosa TaxID=1052685 RepID=A0A8E2DN46_9APHY|nr:hypothetical protein OBBRIDRAFT_372786 [Obba rivulosa]
MTTWTTYPYHMHPWFRMPSLKRKDHSDDSESSSGEYAARSPSPPRVKRRRCDLLEKGLAQLDLNAVVDGSRAPGILAADVPRHVAAASPAQPSFQGPPAWAASTSTSAYPANVPPPRVVRPGSVEEPTSPAQSEIPDVRMKVRTWYEIEKDRIVVTDLEGSDTEGSDVDAPAEPLASVAVSPTLLARMSRQNELPIYARNTSGSNPSQALVLFRPLVKPTDVAADAHEPEEETETTEPEERFVEMDSDGEVMMDTSPLATPPADDAMDIEPL